MKNYPLYHTKNFESFKTFIDDVCNEYNDNPAISSFDAEGRITTNTYENIKNDIYALSESLNYKGLGGKNIAVISPNSYMAVTAIFAAMYQGGTAIPIDVEQTPDSIKAMVKFAEAELIFIADSMLERFSKADFEGKTVVVLSDDKTISGGFYNMLEEGNSLIEKNGRALKDIKIDPAKTALIVFTSGTTTVSKPVMLSHQAVLTNASEAVQYVNIKERRFTSLPVFHAYGFTAAILSTMILGHHLCINGDIRYMVRDLAMFKPSAMFVVPLIAEVVCKKLVDTADVLKGKKGFMDFVKKTAKGALKQDPKLVAVKDKVLPGLNLMICGGAHLSVDIAKVLYRFGICVLEGYGITECSPLISVNRNDFFKFGSVGVVLPNFEMKIEDGEIMVKGKSVMSGYFKQPEMTSEVLNGGWFKTGDLGHIDGDGFLHIKGRKKNLIVLKNGKKVSPEELEELLSEIPMVKEVMVYGSSIGSSADDVVPAASIYPDPDLTKGMSAFEILSNLQIKVDEINERLTGYKQVRLINIRDDELPKTSTKKIKRS